MQRKIGFDFWGVIRSTSDGREEFGAKAWISKIIRSIGYRNCYIISIIPRDSEKAVFSHLNPFMASTGFIRSNIRFLYEHDKLDPDKSEVARDLGLTDYVDDQLRILLKMPKHINVYWYNSMITEQRIAEERARFQAYPNRFPHYSNWKALGPDLLAAATSAAKA